MSESRLMVPALADVQVEGLTRSAFLVRSTLAAGAVYGMGAITPFVGSAFAQKGDEGDIEILNFALTLEFLESEFYKRAIRDVKDLSGDLLATAEQVLEDEDAHVTALETTIKDLGGKAVKSPALNFGDSFKSSKDFLKTAVIFEDTGVSAYNGAAPSIKSKDVLGAAGSIVQVEGRHAALMRSFDGEQPTVGAFDMALDQDEVLEAVQPFIKE